MNIVTEPKHKHSLADWLRREYDALQREVARLTGEVEDLTFCEDCATDCAKLESNGCYPPRYCHSCQQKLVDEIVTLKSQPCPHAAELETLRKVADAAIEWAEFPLKGEITDAMIALGLVVTEYRRLTAPPPLSPKTQAAIERGLKGCEDETKLAEMAASREGK